MIRKGMAVLALAGASVLIRANVLPQSVLMFTPSTTDYYYAGYGVRVTSDVTILGLDSPPGYDQWDGLWVGQDDTTNVMFTFDGAVTDIRIKFTAHTLLDGHEEWWDNFRADGNTVGITLTDNGLFGHETILDAGAVKPLVNDGWGTVSYVGTLTTFEFTHDVISGQPNGTVITEVAWNLVPEPATLAILGLGALALFRRRRN
jgi:hypothetical protein